MWAWWWASALGMGMTWALPPSLRDTVSDIDLTDQRMTSSEFHEMRAALEAQVGLHIATDPIELAGLPEGDVLPDINTDYITIEGNAQEKNAVIEASRLWPDGVVPYKFSAEFVFLPLERYLIRRTMGYIADHSCVRFVERKSYHDDYLKIIYDTNKCYSHIGRQGGIQILSLGFFCVRWWNLGTVYHELLHTLGFYHEHNRPDRDQHVSIKWDNISKGNEKNFLKRAHDAVELIDVPYDIGSVMHYHPYAFAKWRFITPTVVSHRHGTSYRRPRHPSKKDYMKLNRLYKCFWEGRQSYSSIGDTGPPPKWYFSRGLKPPRFPSHSLEHSPNHVDLQRNMEHQTRHSSSAIIGQSSGILSSKNANNSFSGPLSPYVTPPPRSSPEPLRQPLQLHPPISLDLLPPPPPPPSPPPAQHNSFVTIPSLAEPFHFTVDSSTAKHNSFMSVSSVVEPLPFTVYSQEFEDKFANIRSFFDDDEADNRTQGLFDDLFNSDPHKLKQTSVTLVTESGHQ